MAVGALHWAADWEDEMTWSMPRLSFLQPPHFGRRIGKADLQGLVHACIRSLPYSRDGWILCKCHDRTDLVEKVQGAANTGVIVFDEVCIALEIRGRIEQLLSKASAVRSPQVRTRAMWK